MRHTILALLLCCSVLATSADAARAPSVHFINVEHGDAVYIGLPGGIDILIDAGGSGSGECVVEYLSQEGRVDDGVIELMVATHYHKDHYGGLAAVVDAFRVTAVLSPGVDTHPVFKAGVVNPVKTSGGDWRRAVGAEANIEPGHTWGFGDYTLILLGPVKDFGDANDNSIVLKLQGPIHSFLFMGDAEERAEIAMIQHHYAAGTDLTASVLKVGHHGSGTSTTCSLLTVSRPRFAVISDDGSHVSRTTLAWLDAFHMHTYRTDIHGHLVVHADLSVITEHPIGPRSGLPSRLTKLSASCRERLAAATAGDFEAVTGISSQAQAIVEHRNWIGGFLFADCLANVRGIGQILSRRILDTLCAPPVLE